MNLKVEAVSRETIKPARPTPHHLRTFNLSFLDQITAPAVYMPLILFYVDPIMEANNKIIKESSSSSSSPDDLLKNSLSETLTRYYTLAGRMKDDSFSVDCNDAGIDYVEARVLSNNDIRISDVIQHPDIHLLVDQFLPCEPTGFNYSSKALLAVQVNHFENSGGMVIGLLISHTLADASSLITFIKDWAAIARGGATYEEQIESTSLPNLDLLPTLFPQRDLTGFARATGTKREDIVTKRLVFEASKIAELRKRISSSSSSSSTNINGGYDDVQRYLTRVEAVSAFIWALFINAFDHKTNNQGTGGGASAAAAVRMYGVSHAVNMRTRMVPPLPANSFGNMTRSSMAVSINVEGKKDPYPDLVIKVREATKKIDHHQVRKLQATDALVQYMEELEQIYSSCTAILHFTSLCGFPSYEADFGWGKPEWVSAATYPYKNAVALMDTRSRDGIEAWVNMTKEDMAEFERDEQLLAFASKL